MRPRRRRKPIGWSMIAIAVLVAVSAALVWRRDGFSGVLEILTSDLALFGGILPRVLAGCLLGAFIAEILPHEKVSRSLGPNSGLKGLLIGAAFGAILPGGPFTAYPVASALLTVGADFGATIAMVVSWTLIGYGRAVAWELPIMGTDFTLWRIVISLPLPVLAGALGRFVYVRIYPQGRGGMSAALLIDIILWGSVAASASLRTGAARSRDGLAARGGDGLYQHRAAHRARRDRLGLYRRRHSAGDHHRLARAEQRLAWGADRRARGGRDPGGPVIGFSIGAVALKVGGGAPQVIAYVVAWALFAFQRLLLWEIPFMPARFVWFRAAVSLHSRSWPPAPSMLIGKP